MFLTADLETIFNAEVVSMFILIYIHNFKIAAPVVH
jgi:hypothetical protein